MNKIQPLNQKYVLHLLPGDVTDAKLWSSIPLLIVLDVNIQRTTAASALGDINFVVTVVVGSYTTTTTMVISQKTLK